MHPWLALLLLVLVPGLLAGCPAKGTTYNQTTTVNIYGPFAACTVIVLPDFRRVSFGDRDVTVTGPSTINVGNTSYSVDLSGCNATETTTTTTSAGQRS